MKHTILYSVEYDLNKRRERTQVKLYDNHILYTICAFTTTTDVYIKELDTWTLDTSRCSVVTREICIAFMTCICILIASVTFSNTGWKSAILVFVFRNLICRNTLPVVQKRLCFP